MRVPNLHTASKRHLIKIRTFLEKIDFFLKNIYLQDILKGLDSTKFLEILHSNKTPNKFSNHHLKIAFQNPSFVREPFKFGRKYAPPWIQNAWISEFFLLFYIINTQTIYVNEKVHILSRFATLRAISNLIVQYFFIHPVYKTCRLPVNIVYKFISCS